MATTIVPDPKPIKKNFNPEELMADIHEQHLSSQGDMEKAGEIDAHEFYAGQVSILEWVKDLMTEDDKEIEKHPGQPTMWVELG